MYGCMNWISCTLYPEQAALLGPRLHRLRVAYTIRQITHSTLHKHDRQVCSLCDQVLKKIERSLLQITNGKVGSVGPVFGPAMGLMRKFKSCHLFHQFWETLPAPNAILASDYLLRSMHLSRDMLGECWVHLCFWPGCLARCSFASMQAEAGKRADRLLHDDREEQLGMWRGTISDDRTRSSSPSPSYAPHPATRGTYSSVPRDYGRPAPPPSPLVRPALPPTPLLRSASPPAPLARPTSTDTSASQPPPPLGQGTQHLDSSVRDDMNSRECGHSSTAWIAQHDTTA